VVLTNQLITDAHHPDLRNFQISGTDAGMLVAWKQENSNKYLSRLLELFPDLEEPTPSVSEEPLP
jgi:hypothetical protein